MAKYDYDIAVIGGGAAGLTASGICASFGAKTALFEKHRLGGDCTWTGCVPSKALLHLAKEFYRINQSQILGDRFEPPRVDFAAVMDSVRRTRKKIYEDADSPEIMNQRGVEVVHGEARFKDVHSVEVECEEQVRTITFRSAIITSGSSPLVIPINGLEKIDCLTNETIFELRRQPEHLVILGSGPIGVEMAQAFNMLGTRVSVVALDERILIKDEPKCTAMLQKCLEDQGIAFYFGQTIHNIQRKNDGYEMSVGPPSATERKIQCDALLVAVGRKPNLNLCFENAGITYKKDGIPVDKYCRTNVKHIYAAGDITTFFKFTHVSENMAKSAALNAVLRWPLFSFERHVVPWATYTDPECAHLGKTAKELEQEKVNFTTIEFPFEKIDRAVTEHAAMGWIILHTAPSGKILGAHAVGAQAGEIINEYALAMKNGLKLSKISDTIHAYPTMLLGVRRAADQYYVRLQKPWMSKLIRGLFDYQGDIPDYVGTRSVL